MDANDSYSNQRHSMTIDMHPVLVALIVLSLVVVALKRKGH